MAVWIAVAIALAQPLWAQQHSRDLLRFGAIKGENFHAADAWRLVASQWLHVKPPHMLLNAVIIAVVGQALEREVSPWRVAGLGILGGAAGQLAGLLAYPDLVVSGASQAYLALCGMAVILCRRGSWGWSVALAATLIAVALDLFASGHGTIKWGHLVGMMFGLVAGIALSLARRRRVRT